MLGTAGSVITSYSIHYTKLYDDNENAVSPILQEEFALGRQQTRSLTFNLTKNTTDKFIDPSRGTVQSVTVEYAGEPLGGDSDFVKYFLNTKAFFPVTT